MATLLFFGRLQDFIPQGQVLLDLPDTVHSTDLLRDHLDAIWALGRKLHEKTIRVAVNGEVTCVDTQISNNDEIAFMPPVGGG